MADKVLGVNETTTLTWQEFWQGNPAPAVVSISYTCDVPWISITPSADTLSVDITATGPAPDGHSVGTVTATVPGTSPLVTGSRTILAIIKVDELRGGTFTP